MMQQTMGRAGREAMRGRGERTTEVGAGRVAVAVSRALDRALYAAYSARSFSAAAIDAASSFVSM
jgi:hypothetical protein